jgi:hypothetical protein
MFLRQFGRLPDEVGRQKPSDIFFVIAGLVDSGESPEKSASIPPHARMFYGL